MIRENLHDKFYFKKMEDMKEIIPNRRDFISESDDDFTIYDLRWHRFNRDWWLSEDGDMLFGACNWPLYNHQIAKGLTDDMILHLSVKPWFDANTFIPAYMEAKRISSKKQ